MESVYLVGMMMMMMMTLLDNIHQKGHSISKFRAKLVASTTHRVAAQREHAAL